MKHRALVLFVGLLSMATIWAFGHARRTPRPEAPGVAAAGPADVAAPDPEPAPVRIEQRLVRVEVVQSPPAPARVRLASAKRAAPRKAGLLARARRVVFGEGRHKPTPFPRLQ